MIITTTKTQLHILRNIIRAIHRYKNWRDLIMSILKGHRPTTVILRNGIRINAPGNNTLWDMMDEIFFSHVYNPVDLPIECNDIVVDIGANIGVFALFAAQRTKNTVFAFEPFSPNVEFLKQNAYANGFHNIAIHQCAVSDKIGSVRLFLSEISGGHLLFDHNIKGRLEKYVEVASTTLQSIVDDNNLRRIDFLKLDCEGSEGAILQATPRDCLKKVCKVAMEFHDNVSQLKHDEIQNLLVDAGFVTRLAWSGDSSFGYLYGRRDRGW